MHFDKTLNIKMQLIISTQIIEYGECTIIRLRLNYKLSCTCLFLQNKLKINMCNRMTSIIITFAFVYLFELRTGFCYHNSIFVIQMLAKTMWLFNATVTSWSLIMNCVVVCYWVCTIHIKSIKILIFSKYTN